MNAQVKVGCLVAGMVAGADSIDDLDVLRHGALPTLFGGVRAPSTLGSFLRAFTWGNVLQLQKVSRLLLAGLAGRTPLLPGADVLAFVDLDSMQKRVYGHAKQGAAFGYTKIRAKPAGAGPERARPRRSAPAGGAGDRRHPAAAAAPAPPAAASMAAKRCGPRSGWVHRHDRGRADSAFTARRWLGHPETGAFFWSPSIAPKGHAAIAAIGGDAWTPIRYPRALWMTSWPAG